MGLDVSEADLHAYVDDRLDPARRAEVQEWLRAHPGDAERVAADRLLAEQWRAAYAPVLEEPVPEALLAPLQRRRRRWPAHIALGLAMAASVVLAVGLWFYAVPDRAAQQRAAEMVQRAAMAHIVYATEVTHPVEGPRDRTELLAWLSGRLGMKIEPPDLRKLGMAFVGGRLLPGDKAPAALLMYEDKAGRRVTMYWGPEFRQHEETHVKYARAEQGTRVAYWLDEECGYALASSDLGREDLLRVAELAYAQTEK